MRSLRLAPAPVLATEHIRERFDLLYLASGDRIFVGGAPKLVVSGA